MLLHDWIERLSVIADVDIKGAADLAAARRAHQRDTIYVMYSTEAADNNLLSQGVQQRVRTEMAVVMAVTNRRDKEGSRGVTELESLRDRVRAVLLGWIPPGRAAPITYRRGRLLHFDEATLWWQDEYEGVGYIEAC